MYVRLLLAAVSSVLAFSTAPAQSPVTSSQARSPADAMASRWHVAAFEATFPEFSRKTVPLSEAARMLVTVQKGEPLGPGVAWYGPSQRRHDWPWLAERFDANHDGRIAADERSAFEEALSAIDRDRDGFITAADLDWSERSPWVQQEALALRIFRQIDRDGNGKITTQEMQSHFDRSAGSKGFWTPADLRDGLLAERGRGKKAYADYWVGSLFAGDLGSPFEGPRVGHEAPDFTLTSASGDKPITLSQFRGEKPVVLIFGSFT